MPTSNLKTWSSISIPSLGVSLPPLLTTETLQTELTPSIYVAITFVVPSRRVVITPSELIVNILSLPLVQFTF